MNQVTASRPNDSWTTLDFPVLQVIERWHFNVAQDRQPNLRPEPVARDMGRDDHDVEVRGALQRLLGADYIKGASIADDPYDYVMVLGITERGLRATGAWPTEVTMVAALVQMLDDLAEREEAQNPEQASKLRGAATVVKQMGVSVVTEVAAKFAAHLAGL